MKKKVNLNDRKIIKMVYFKSLKANVVMSALSEMEPHLYVASVKIFKKIDIFFFVGQRKLRILI